MSQDKLNAKRGNIKGQLTRFIDYLETSTNKNEIEVRLKKMEELFDKFDEVQSQIEERDESEIDKREQFENLYYSALAKAKGIITQTPNIVSEVKLSPLQVPSFTGNYEDWLHFRDTFKSLVDSNSNLSDLQKFHYLLSSLKGQALQMVSSLEITSNNYKTAWEILSSRYHNKRIIADKHVRSLFNMQSIKNEDSIALRKLIDETQLHLRALETMNLPTSTWDALLVHLVTGKLDPVTRHHWESYILKDELPTYKELISCLSERARVIESTHIARAVNHNKARVNLHTEITLQRCPQCKGDHKLFACVQFTSQTIEQRQETIKRLKLCFNCLRPNHNVRTCSSKSTCKVCNKKHNTLLHKAGNQPAANENAVQTYSSQGGNEVLLSTVIVELNQNGTKHQVRALLDCGAQSNFVTKSLCDRLMLQQHNLCIPVSGIHRQVTTVTSGVNITIRSQFSSYERNINCLVLPEITNQLPQNNIDIRTIKIPKGLQLADPKFNKRAPVDMLLGAEVFWEVIKTESEATSNSLLHNTLFGWVVAGQIPSPRNHPNQVSNLQNKSSLCHISLNQLHKDVERFWLVEELSTKIPFKSKEDIACEDHFTTTYRRDETGRFVVRLPFKNNQPELGESLEIAIKRQLALERRFRSDHLLHREYCKFMEEYQTLGHMTPCVSTAITPVNYLPHHAVHKTNKIRVVFDGSQKTTNGKSINDVLMTGPQIQRDLLTLLLNFRKHMFVMTADIEKMYRQFKVHEEDRNFQKIVWRSSEDMPLQHFRLNTVTYGLAPSSFIATRCLKQLSIDFADTFPLASQVINNDFYMDDLLTGCDNKETCLQLKEDVSRILKSAG